MTIATLALLLMATAPEAGATPTAPVLLEFTASWCGPCQKVKPEVERLARRDVPVRVVDVDDDPRSAKKYDVGSVPTFVVVDARGAELARTEGYQTAEELGAFYREAKSRADVRRAARPDDSDEAADGPRGGARPNPWESSVRITVHGPRTLGYGSGTVIYSDDEKSIILTCAHIFTIDEARRQPAPANFPRRITVELFGGPLGGPKKQMAKPVTDPIEGRAVDYDFETDVGLIVVRPGRKLPHSPVVPASWQPRVNMKMMTVGCPEGKNATAWSTWITESQFRGMKGKPGYEAIQCQYAPIQGRSGGGLFTTDGYVAGVCDFAFADPGYARGLYASPKSIYRMLDRNRLTVCYDPRSARPGAPDTALAQADPPSRPARSRPIVRGQDPKEITIPRPEMVGVDPLEGDEEYETLDVPPARVAAGSTGRRAWRASPGMVPAANGEPVAAGLLTLAGEDEPEAEADDALDLDPPGSDDATAEPDQAVSPSSRPRPGRGWRPVATP